MNLMNHIKFQKILLVIFWVTLLWSAINPKDRITWFLEVTPAVLGCIGLILLDHYKNVKFTKLSYILLTISGVIILVGGHYTYGDMPVFNWVKEFIGCKRNYFDRFGHFIFGITTVMVCREILLRFSPLRRGKILTILSLSLTLAMAAIYEILEWVIAIISASNASAFLGLQGDIWDTQWDMFLALMGGILALLTLRKIQDRQLEKTNSEEDL
jgi:putative membrane protein